MQRREDIVEAIRTLAAQHCRKIEVEAMVTLATGLVITLLMFGGVFWISALVLWFIRPFGLSGVMLAGILTAVLFVVSVYSAWRAHEPLAAVQGMNENVHDLQMGLGYALGVPVVNRQSIAGFASLLIGGPRNVMDACLLWRSRIRADERLLAQAHQVLLASRDGAPHNLSIDARAIALLHRLGLIKASPQNGIVVLQPTMKGQEILSTSR